MTDQEVRAALVTGLGDRYRVDSEPFAAGGMALIYGAQDVRHGRRVAIKLMRPEQAVVFGAERFLREINLTANLQHPHILPLLDSGTVDYRGVALPFYVMPLVVGQSLRTKLDATGPLPLPEIVAITRDVAEGLQHAHDRGLIHRDIKPENILLNESGAALIADFGVARATGATGPSGLTEQGVTVGTPTYMSPEQLFDGAGLGPATDQFSLAAVAFEMLTGRAPFEATTREELVARRLAESPLPLRQLRPDLPEGVERAVTRGLERKPTDRYPTVRDFAAALGGAITDSGGSTTPGRSRRFLVAATVLAVGTALSLWWWNRPARVVAGGAMVMLADVENLTADSTLGPALRVAAAVGLQQSSSLSIYPRTALRQSLARMGRTLQDTVLSEGLAREIAYREGGQAVIVLTVADVGGTYGLSARILDPVTGATLAAKRRTVGHADQLLDATDHLVGWLRKNLGDPKASQARPLPLVTTASLQALQSYAAARTAVARGEWERTRRLIDRAIELDTGFAMAQGFKGEFLVFMNDVPGGLRWLREADRRTPRLSEAERLNVKMHLAAAEGRTNDRIDIAGELATRFPSAAHWHEYGEALRLAERPDEAIAALNRAIAIDSTNPEVLYDLALAHRRRGDGRTALDYFARIESLEPAFLLRGFATQEWGRTFLDQGNLPQAESVFRKLLPRADPIDRGRGFRLLGYLALYRGHYGEATSFLRKSIPLWTPASLSEYRDQVLLADAELTRGNAAAAGVALDRAFEIFRKTPIQAAAVMFGGHQFVRAGQLDRGRLLLDSLRARAALRPNARQDQEALAILELDVALAEGRLPAATATVGKLRHAEYASLSFGLAAEFYAVRGQRDSAVAFAKRATESRAFGLEVQQDWFRSFGQLARLAEAVGDSATARQAYSQLVEMWQGGDPDLPPLVTARRELARLQSPASR